MNKRHITDEQLDAWGEEIRGLQDMGLTQQAARRRLGLTGYQAHMALMTREERTRYREHHNRTYHDKCKHATARRIPPIPLDAPHLTKSDHVRLLQIKTCRKRGLSFEQIDRRYHWRPGETVRQLEGLLMCLKGRARAELEAYLRAA